MPSRGNDAALIENICVLLHPSSDFLCLVSKAAEILGRIESDFSITSLGALTCWVQSWAGIMPSDQTRGGPNEGRVLQRRPVHLGPPQTSHLGAWKQMFVFALGRRVSVRRVLLLSNGVCDWLSFVFASFSELQQNDAGFLQDKHVWWCFPLQCFKTISLFYFPMNNAMFLKPNVQNNSNYLNLMQEGMQIDKPEANKNLFIKLITCNANTTRTMIKDMNISPEVDKWWSFC